MWYKNVSTSFFRFVIIHAFDRQTDGQTDILLMAKTALQRGEKDEKIKKSLKRKKCEKNKKSKKNVSATPLVGFSRP